ncbi:hypothetical protein EYF80_015648 [Liparis tanakae]|uniref:Uncharacterized protein n=1 Tax=Liparis tanakae TaxID=230148 RepID=A0A4Z2IAP1_9TELE|nr:hypothetical protein EYF80_015648 [Liparis tanakae]
MDEETLKPQQQPDKEASMPDCPMEKENPNTRLWALGSGAGRQFASIDDLQVAGGRRPIQFPFISTGAPWGISRLIRPVVLAALLITSIHLWRRTHRGYVYSEHHVFYSATPRWCAYLSKVYSLSARKK